MAVSRAVNTPQCKLRRRLADIGRDWARLANELDACQGAFHDLCFVYNALVLDWLVLTFDGIAQFFSFSRTAFDTLIDIIKYKVIGMCI